MKLCGKHIEPFLQPWDKEDGLPAHWAFLKVCDGWIPLVKLLKQAGKTEYVTTHYQPKPRKSDLSQQQYGSSLIRIEIHLIANWAYGPLLTDHNFLNVGSALVKPNSTVGEACQPIHQAMGS